MRTEKEMFDLILNTAKENDNVLAVCMNGSRTNQNVPRDVWQDFDIVYIVSELEWFNSNPNWIDIFGERTIMQMPENATLFKPSFGGKRTVYLMQFEDGNRIDLSLILPEDKDEYLASDKLTEVLLDKGDFLPKLPAPSDEDYHVRMLSAEEFFDCCNEFWWVSPYVAKGLWRNEILYAMELLNPVREMLLRMLECRIFIEQGETVSIGKCGKYLQKYVTADTYLSFLKTYPTPQEGCVWASLFTAFELFRETAKFVALKMSYSYNLNEDARVTRYVRTKKQA